MLGEGEAATGLLDDLADEGDLGVSVGVEVVEADDGADARAADDVDVGEQVAAAPGLEELEVLLGVGRVKGRAGLDVGAAAVTLEGAHGGHEHHRVGAETGATALDVPELLVAHVRGEAALRDGVVGEGAGHAVGDDGVLPNGDVGEGAGMHEHGLALDGLHQGGIEGADHPGGHGAGHFQVVGGDGRAALGVGHDDLADAAA